jgi:predicted ABC-type ATPase
MAIPRFRMFAGPNGSGKTTFYESIRNAKLINTEIYISADRIEEALKEKGKFNFNPYHIKISDLEFNKYIVNSGLYLENKLDETLLENIYIKSGVLYIQNTLINSYHASFVANYLVEKLLQNKKSFCFETVMSHPSKLLYLDQAKKLGYKTYFYFLFTNNVEINLKRIKERVLYGKHNVSDEKVVSRFYKTFALISKAINLTDNVYLINNTYKMAVVEYAKKNNTIKNNIPNNSILLKYLN